MFEVFTAMKIQIVVFWVVMPCSDVVGYRRFGGPCCLHLHHSSSALGRWRRQGPPKSDYLASQLRKLRLEIVWTAD